MAGTPWVVVASALDGGLALVNVATGEHRTYDDFAWSMGMAIEGAWTRLLLAGPFNDPALIDFRRGTALGLVGILGPEGRSATLLVGGPGDHVVVLSRATMSWCSPRHRVGWSRWTTRRVPGRSAD